MNILDNIDDIPFVNEECGDTMWDESILDQLTQSVVSNQAGSTRATVETTQPPVKQTAVNTNNGTVEKAS